MDYRHATADDIAAVATLHADSWRRYYRGSFSDAYLDGDVLTDRMAVWTERLTAATADQDSDTVGFVHTVLDADPTWGALLDNLHVAHNLHGSGVGTQLMARSAAAVLGRTPTTGLYLWVLERNTAAQAFYKARGAQHEGSEWTEAPGGGAVLGLRYTWRDPNVLLL